MFDVAPSEGLGPKTKLQFSALLERLGPMLSPAPETDAKKTRSRQQQMESWLDVLAWQLDGNWLYSRVFVAGETASEHEARQRIMADVAQKEQLCIVAESGDVSNGKSFAITTLQNEMIGYLQPTNARALKLELKRGNDYLCFACESVSGTRDRVGIKVALVRVSSEKKQRRSNAESRRRLASFALQA